MVTVCLIRLKLCRIIFTASYYHKNVIEQIVLLPKMKISKTVIKNKLINLFIILLIFFLDRFSKIYLLHLYESGIETDFYIYSFLNISLVWNTGIGFGLFSSDANFVYHSITAFIGLINLIIVYMVYIIPDVRKYFLLMILGGSFGNFFDRIYYYAVTDFIDFHLGNFHWFIFNIADIFITLGIIGLLFVELTKKEKISKNA